MKYLCQWCERLADAARFRVDGAELVLTCTKCGAETRARPAEASTELVAVIAADPAEPAPPPPAPAPAAAPEAPVTPLSARVVPIHAVPPPTFGGDDPFAVPEGRCPKCVAPRQPDALACNQCGLVFDNFVAGEHRSSPELEVVWKELVARWDDLAAHDRALASAAARGELAVMGRLYRIRLARQPRDPIATRGRDEVLRLASSTTPFLGPHQASAKDGTESAQRSLMVVAAAMVGMSLLFLGWLMFFNNG